MSATIQLKFGTLEFDDTNNITISGINQKSAKPVQTTQIPLMDGAIAETAKIGPATINIEGDIAGAGYEALRTNLDALKAGLLGQGLAKLTKDDQRYIYCQMKDFSYKYDHLTRRATWSASFVAHYPFWLSETLTTDVRAPTSGASYIITNQGNAPTRVKIEITANGLINDAMQVENLTLGQTFQYRGLIAAAATLLVDNRVASDDFVVTNSGVDDPKNFEGDFLTLGMGTNLIEPTWTSTNATAPSIKLSWRDCWY
jgi:hypothetical protein